MSEVKAEPYFLQDFLDKDILISEDIYWMLDNMKQSNSERSQYLWAKMIEQSFDRQDGKQIERLLNFGCQRLHKRFELHLILQTLSMNESSMHVSYMRLTFLLHNRQYLAL